MTMEATLETLKAHSRQLLAVIDAVPPGCARVPGATGELCAVLPGLLDTREKLLGTLKESLVPGESVPVAAAQEIVELDRRIVESLAARRDALFEELESLPRRRRAASAYQAPARAGQVPGATSSAPGAPSSQETGAVYLDRAG